MYNYIMIYKKERIENMRYFIYKLRSALAHYKAKLLLAFLICTMFPILITGIIAYRLSYKIATKQITDAAISSSDQINVQLNARITQAENVSDTIQFNMYTLLQSRKLNRTDYINAFSDTRNTLYLFKSTFDFYHIYAFLNPNQLGSREDLYFLSIDQLSNFQVSKNELNTIGSSSIWMYKHNINCGRAGGTGGTCPFCGWTNCGRAGGTGGTCPFCGWANCGRTGATGGAEVFRYQLHTSPSAISFPHVVQYISFPS